MRRNRLSRGEKVFWTIALLIGVELAWMRFLEPGSPAQGALDPLVFSSPAALLQSLWGGLIAWAAAAVVLWKLG